MKNEFERRLAAGEDPMKAAEAIVTNYTNFLRRPTAQAGDDWLREHARTRPDEHVGPNRPRN